MQLGRQIYICTSVKDGGWHQIMTAQRKVELALPMSCSIDSISDASAVPTTQ